MGCGKEIKGGWTGVFLALVTTDARMDPVRSDLCHPAGTEGAEVLRGEQVPLARERGETQGQKLRAKPGTSSFRHSLFLLIHRLQVPIPWPRRTPQPGIL